MSENSLWNLTNAELRAEVARLRHAAKTAGFEFIEVPQGYIARPMGPEVLKAEIARLREHYNEAVRANTKAVKSRDEARAAAQHIFDLLSQPELPKNCFMHLAERWPWLED